MLGRLQREYAAKGLEVIAIDINGSPASEWIGFWQSNDGGDVTWGVVTDAQMVRNYRVTVLGQTAVVSGDGELVYNGPSLRQIVLGVVMAVGLIAAVACGVADVSKEGSASPRLPAPDFTIPVVRMADTGGFATSQFTLSEQRASPLVLYFSFPG